MYSELRDAWRLERSSFKLQRIPQDLYDRVRSYLRELRSRRLSEGSPIAVELLKAEEEVVRQLAIDLFELRVLKALYAALEGGRREELECLVEEERHVLDELLGVLERWRRGLIEEEAEELELVLVVREVLRVEVDGVAYGPFKENDVAYLPSKVASRLVEEGAAVRL